MDSGSRDARPWTPIGLTRHSPARSAVCHAVLLSSGDRPLLDIRMTGQGGPGSPE